MLIGDTLVGSIWGAVGGVVVLGILVIVIFKYFVGAQKNIPAGIGVLLGTAVIIAFITNRTAFEGIGKAIAGLITGG